MASRPTWKGSIKLSLITIPIRVFTATDTSSDVSFRQLHRKCHTPIQLKKWCPHCNEEVTAKDIVKGYESSKGRFVIVEEQEIDALKPETTHVIDVTDVIETHGIDPIYVERVYYVAPDTKQSGYTFAVLREALDGLAAVGRLALHGREYLVAIVPAEDVLRLYTLRTAGEVRETSGIDTLEFGRTKTKPDEVKLARQVLGALRTDADLSTFNDTYETALRAMLASKEPTAVTGTAAPAERGGRAGGGNVVNLMDQLRRSLARVSAETKATARESHTAPAKRARVLAHPAANKKRRRAS